VRTLGIVLVVLGALALGFGSFTYVTRGKAGEAEKRKTIWIPPVASGIVVVSGLLLIAIGSRRSTA